MKVLELIEELKKFAPNTLVVIPGYEGGFDEVHQAQRILLALHVNDEQKWYYGEHEDLKELPESDILKYQTVDAICIGEKSRQRCRE